MSGHVTAYCLAALLLACVSQLAFGQLAPASSGPKAQADTVTRPAWAELTGPQRQALAPLESAWNTVSEAQKRKWLALSQNYAKLPPAEQAMMHSRMAEWAAMSPQQRTQARLNFAETKQLAPDDKKAKWAAYQALSTEEKRKLAADAPARTPGTAAAVKPVSPNKLATVPKPPGRESRGPRIASGASAEPGIVLTPPPAPPALGPVPAAPIAAPGGPALNN